MEENLSFTMSINRVFFLISLPRWSSNWDFNMDVSWTFVWYSNMSSLIVFYLFKSPMAFNPYTWQVWSKANSFSEPEHLAKKALSYKGSWRQSKSNLTDFSLYVFHFSLMSRAWKIFTSRSPTKFLIPSIWCIFLSKVFWWNPSEN